MLAPIRDAHAVCFLIGSADASSHRDSIDEDSQPTQRTILESDAMYRSEPASDAVAESHVYQADSNILEEQHLKQRTSSYENVYDGIPLDPELNRMSLDASEMDVGDRFDTKQQDLHLQQAGKSSSFEDLYQAAREEVEGE